MLMDPADIVARIDGVTETVFSERANCAAASNQRRSKTMDEHSEHPEALPARRSPNSRHPSPRPRLCAADAADSCRAREPLRRLRSARVPALVSCPRGRPPHAVPPPPAAAAPAS